ncbi:MAG: transporter substrate-binding domain-containing protein [Verrucomicrobiota bacterium]|jgi:ABC-type amino acid transport substrate-binding protein|nr:transporter substrate-binding domain-containing protein [Verrucomicrobiota bacterium]MDP7049089.1 transporter substrate-binding domain-containing protein [Verrucomicrobiota bacterium]
MKMISNAFAFAFFFGFCHVIFAQKSTVIGIKEAPPFAFKDSKGEWVGITVDLWKEIQGEQNAKFLPQEMALDKLLIGIERGEIETGLGAISIIYDREKKLDFSIPYFETGLALAVRIESEGNVSNYIDTLGKVIKALIPWILLLLVVGVLIWFLEKKINEDQFHKPLGEGIGSGIWWACVTMTTVGYGDKTPKSFFGRIIAVGWMFSGIILISSLTATITTSMTIDRLYDQIASLDDLKKQKTGAIESTSAVDLLQDNGITHGTFPTLNEGLAALSNGKINVLIHDEPIMKHVIAQKYSGMLQVLDIVMDKQLYAFPVQDNAIILEQINLGIIKAIESGKVESLIQRYLHE